MSIALGHMHHAYAQTDGTYKFPDSREGDILKQAKKELEELEAEASLQAARMATAASDILRLNNDNRELEFQVAALEKHMGEDLSLIHELQAQVDAIKPIADYANRQADMAQSRLLKQGDLYDDTYWQPVLDKIRFDLSQIAAIKGVDGEQSS